MEYNKLPGTNIDVSKICLGTMTWGRQNSDSEAYEQMDYSLDHGVNFFDTAELYPVPATPDRYADTERIIGNWFSSRNNRDKIILATKIAGPGSSIEDAVNGSLERLKTDYIDLYQLHWPERMTNFFGKRGFNYVDDGWEDNFQEILEKLKKIVNQGKIRHIGLSNENPWGFMKFIEYSKIGLPKMITIQNPYSLLNRLFEIGNAEVCKREETGLLAYSPLGFGVLSGKYRNGRIPDNSRLKLFPNLSRFSNDNCIKAVDMYYQISQKYNMTLAEMSLAFVNDRPFVTSNIIGATSMDQLKENINSINIKLSDDIIYEINKVNEEIPNPAP